MGQDLRLKLGAFNLYLTPVAPFAGDEGWRRGVATCQANGAYAEAHLSFRRLEIENLLEDLRSLERFEPQRLVWEPLEREPRLTFRRDKLGRLAVTVEMNLSNSEHRFHLDLDQSFLPEAIVSCRTLLGAW